MINLKHKNIRFLAREKTSDEKTFNEVIVGNTYEKKDFKINKGEHWIDLGGNVGAFALKAISKGATVEIYEPDPFNCKQIEKNLKVNGYNATIHQKAVVATDKKEMIMYVGNNLQTWRNSLYKNWGNQKFKVPCIHFSEVIKRNHCVKMDIEGAEMPILEAMEVYPKKMVFEWSFDIDGSLQRYRKVVDKLRKEYHQLNFVDKRFYELPDEYVPKQFIVKANNVYCL
jgi:FkbM family methyltransferase